MSLVAIVGGGISGLATAYLLKQGSDLQLRIFEKDPFAGGKVQTREKQGYTFDWGPNGFLANTPETLELITALNLQEQLQPASVFAKRRYLYTNGALRVVPTTPVQLLGTELLSLTGKLRLALEPFSTRSHEGEESVYAFLKRHFGGEFADTFAQTAVSGITAGDAKRLSLDALFPRLRALEHEHGSLIRALLSVQRQTRSHVQSGRLTSFKAGGIQTLIGRLQESLGVSLETGSAVCKLVPQDKGYQLWLQSGRKVEADAVVLATPAFTSAKLLEPFLPDVARSLANIPYANVSVFGLGYDRIDVPHPLDGFGFLAARGAGLRALGVLFSSTLFLDRAPPDKVMLRVICGGSLDPDFADLSDKDALSSVKRDLKRSLGILAEPEMKQCVRWPRAIPQYELGHREKVKALMQGLLPGLYLTGNAFYGVGLNDCIRDAHRVVRTLTAKL